MKNLIVGAIDNYNWENIRNWIRSIKKVEFTGDVVLLTYRIEDSVINRIKEEYPKIKMFSCETDDTGQKINHTDRNRDTQVHQMRFFHLWRLFVEGHLKKDDYKYVIFTDTRDVVFQRNPDPWLSFTSDIIIAPSENILYKNEPWNAQNVLDAYGQYGYDIVKDKLVANVGTIAVKASFMPDFAYILYTMGKNRLIPNDQATFGILLHTVFNDYKYHGTSNIVPSSKGWAAQIGVSDDPSKSYLLPYLIEPKPEWEDGILVNHVGIPYVLIHQYERNEIYKKYFNDIYKD